jgi:hypothetical protein
MLRRFLIIIVAVAIAYVTCYFLCVRDDVVFTASKTFSLFPRYRFVPVTDRYAAVLFGPIHTLDRKWLRPHKWEGVQTGKETWKDSGNVQEFVP